MKREKNVNKIYAFFLKTEQISNGKIPLRNTGIIKTVKA